MFNRGFGFVTFANAASVSKVLGQAEHFIDNKRVDPKQATTKNETPSVRVKCSAMLCDILHQSSLVCSSLSGSECSSHHQESVYRRYGCGNYRFGCAGVLLTIWHCKFAGAIVI